MKIGVVSDTHNNLKNCNRIVEMFNEAAVDRVVHTGDITQAKTLEIFSKLTMPMWGVYGNNDLGEMDSLVNAASQFSFEIIEPPMTLSWLEKSIVVVHDPLELSMVNPDHYDVILHGHTHRQTIEYDGNQLTFNPGECAGHMSGFNAIGILDLSDLQVEILNF
ncbi:MAG: YfcE family phosphodiesterase [Pseudomonadales bacterium]|nr:YfcE family phosphodiesterase [Pseudomonadales bacterium]MBO6564737.1 YfcE family phosphodiesterase [Pseudomonadales bacterium]MBO6595086.1 YfcE family phosphodiesterase [Pseudomonadales bacterium]MBO6657114.1 YfcE family phosphodiesterase [Pseudomonadales bacterium]MBO6701591.1 YfcE family phosphodiesterase [Pseudomonadales bacterium]